MGRSAAFLLATTVLAACAQAPDPRGVDRGEVLLQVSGTGRAETRPDEARFTAGVETIAATAAAASAANAEKSNRVIAAIEKLGIKGDDLQTRSITMSRIDYGAERGRFRADNMIEVRVRDVDKAGRAISAATDAGANVLSGPDLRVSDPEAAGRAASARAYRSARARADAYAEAAGMKVVRVLAIRDADSPQGYGYDFANMAAADMSEGVAQATVRPGVNSSEVRVRADFALAPK